MVLVVCHVCGYDIHIYIAVFICSIAIYRYYVHNVSYGVYFFFLKFLVWGVEWWLWGLVAGIAGDLGPSEVMKADVAQDSPISVIYLLYIYIYYYISLFGVLEVWSKILLAHCDGNGEASMWNTRIPLACVTTWNKGIPQSKHIFWWPLVLVATRFYGQIESCQ